MIYNIHNKHRKISGKLMSIVILLMLVVSVLMSVFIGLFYAASLRTMKSEEILGLIETASEMVDTEQFEALLRENAANEYYDSLKEKWNNVTGETNLIFLYLAKPENGEAVYLIEGSSLPGYESSFASTDDLENFGETFVQAMEGKTPPVDFYNTPEYGQLASVYRPFYNAKGEIICVIGGDLDASIINKRIIEVVVLVMGVFLLTTLLFCAVYYFTIRRIIIRPLTQATEMTNDIAAGRVRSADTDLQGVPNDEMGSLLSSYQKMAHFLTMLIDDMQSVLERIASGDLTAKTSVSYIGDFAPLGIAMNGIADSMGGTLQRLRSSAEQVNTNAVHVAGGARSLSGGSMRQTQAVEQLSGAIHGLSKQMLENAQRAKSSKELSGELVGIISQLNDKTNQLTETMKHIGTKSDAIKKIIKVIEDIAFQTNILALNVAVEAARAGVAGKGFAVVADEVRNLAGKSAESVKGTEQLIGETMQAVQGGAAAADEIAAVLQSLVVSSETIIGVINMVAESSAQQVETVKSLNLEVETISGVVQLNSVTSQESAATSQELSAQAGNMKELVDSFTLN